MPGSSSGSSVTPSGKPYLPPRALVESRGRGRAPPGRPRVCGEGTRPRVGEWQAHCACCFLAPASCSRSRTHLLKSRIRLMKTRETFFSSTFAQDATSARHVGSPAHGARPPRGSCVRWGLQVRARVYECALGARRSARRRFGSCRLGRCTGCDDGTRGGKQGTCRSGVRRCTRRRHSSYRPISPCPTRPPLRALASAPSWDPAGPSVGA